MLSTTSSSCARWLISKGLQKLPRGYITTASADIEGEISRDGNVPLLQGSNTVKPFSEIPGPKGWQAIKTLPYFQRLSYKADYLHYHLIEQYKKYGPIFKDYLSGETTVHVFDPELAQQVYRQDGKTPYTSPLLQASKDYREHRKMSGGLGNVNGEEWLRLRRAAQTVMMKPVAVMKLLPHVDEVVTDFVKYIENKKHKTSHVISDIEDALKKWSVESTSLACFETRVGALDNRGENNVVNDLIAANENLFACSRKLKFDIPVYKTVPTRTWQKLVKSEDNFYRIGGQLVQDAIKRYSEIDPEHMNDRFVMLSNLISNSTWTYEEFFVTIMTVMGDSLNTTVPSMVNLLYCIGTNPEAQDLLYKEILTKGCQFEKPLQTAHISNIPYFRACMKEMLRLYPVGTEVPRYAQQEYELAGYHIPKDSLVFVHTNLLLRSSKYFPDPDTYIPERWLKGNEKEAKVHPYLLTPFSVGPRMCIGRRIAEQEMAALTFRLLQKYRIECVTTKPLKQVYKVILQPEVIPHFRFVPRDV